MKHGTAMTEEMVAFLDRHATDLTLTGLKTSRNEIIRECISRVAWDYFGEDIE